ncbi:MAG: TrbG/VirB9 family P-type conjugative transfer protein [Sphingomicrobium sp.]
MTWRVVAALLPLLAAAPLSAEIQPHPSGSDPHFQAVDFVEGQVVQLTAAPGYELMVELSPDEQIRNVAIGDTGSWLVSANKDGNRLFLKPTQAGSATNMTVVTSVRTYAFDLRASDGASMDTPYTVEFRYPAPQTAAKDSQYLDVSALARRISRYRLSGDRQLRPSAISNDGEHTYISWPKSVPIPAIYAVNGSGAETLVNGMMGTDDVYVVDGTPQELIFRIDRSVARAERLNPRKGA